MAYSSQGIDTARQVVTPRGLNREQSATYIGVSSGTFDQLILDSLMPQPRMLRTRRVWDIEELDQYFNDLPHSGASQMSGRGSGSTPPDLE